jgi:putative photosynthetic complex assembly protein
VSDPFRDRPFPRAPLIGIAVLLGTVLLFVGFVRLTGIGAERVVDAPTVVEKSLRFEDRSDGSIAVYDASRDVLIDTIAPGSNGFMRGTLRGLARERKRQGVGAEVPFRLVAHSDGRLTLIDTGTARRVDLDAFGPTNVAAFAQLLTVKAAAR